MHICFRIPPKRNHACGVSFDETPVLIPDTPVGEKQEAMIQDSGNNIAENPHRYVIFTPLLFTTDKQKTDNKKPALDNYKAICHFPSIAKTHIARAGPVTLS